MNEKDIFKFQWPKQVDIAKLSSNFIKLDSITYKQDGEALTGLGVSLSKSCRSPFFEGRTHKKSQVKPITVDLSQIQVSKIGLKVSLEQGEDGDGFYGIRIYSD